MHIELALVGLFVVATGVAMVARRLKTPYTVALVVAGLMLGTATDFEPIHLTKELLYAVFLPGLLFEAAFALEFKNFWANKLAISSLALPGVIAAIALTTLLLVPVANGLHFVDSFTLADGFIFAAVIAATDPIAVVALFKSLGAPKRLAVLVEGESLLNDGTAVVLFTIVLGVAMGGEFSLSAAVLEFIKVVGMGIVIGGAVGYAVSLVIKEVDDPMIEITLTTIAAYGSFVFAEYFHFSGVIATVVAGMLCGNYAARVGMSPSTRVAVGTFWEYLAFALNSLVFLLIGFEVRVGALLAAWKPIVIAYLAVTLGRALVMAVVGALLSRTREKLSWRWVSVLTWGGLRGSLSMVLVLGLPLALPHRDLIITMTFGVVILSILIQGLTMGPLLRVMKLVGARPAEGEYDRLKGQLRGAAAALEEIKRMEHEGAVSAPVAEDLRAQFEARQVTARSAIGELHLKAEDLVVEERRSALRRALSAEKDAVHQERHAGRISAESQEALLADIDARLVNVQLEHE
ncbi:MAG: Na+/H+ antiporter [Archangium sp.]|nr:Na+/H+ antiporter [Archangium sp.]MDP3155791.1 Na+/H+ antiporter [Archangium sp.]MDP3574033.1 Na+/H+ antiporter [Archangium sp.]